MVKMNILFVSPGYKPYLGGTERIVEQLSKEYLRLGEVDQVGVLTTFMDFNHMPPKRNSDLRSKEVMDGVKVYRVNFAPKHLGFFYTLPAGLISWQVKRVIEDFQPHIIHFLLCEWFVANAWIYLLTRKKNHHVYTIPFHEPPERLRYLPMKYVNAFLGRKVDKVQVHSLYIKKRVTEYYHIPKEKIEVIPLGSSFKTPFEVMEKRPPKDVIHLISVGRLSYDKGQLELLQVFNNVYQKLAKETRLILVGGDGGHQKEIEQYIEKNGLEKWVTLVGSVSEDELDQFYRQGDIFILLTRVESFGLVFAEAQSYGLPIIGYRIGPLEAVFKKGAILVDPFHQDKVAEAIEHLVNDDDLRSELSRQAFEYARDHFSWENTAMHFLALYHKVLGNES